MTTPVVGNCQVNTVSVQSVWSWARTHRHPPADSR